jgi:tripartite-type tricarboxylate transporter receptor subunit TctC
VKSNWKSWLCAGVAAALPLAALAQAFPSKPVRIVVPWTPGGGVDMMTRILQPKFAEGLGQPVVIDNRAGAAGTIGTDHVAKSAPDGYTIIVGSPGPMSIAAVLQPKLPYRPDGDLAAVARTVLISNILVVGNNVPANNVNELIALARAQPGKLSFGSSGMGSALQLTGELFKLMAKVDMLHVPYKGTAPALADIMAGQTQLMFADPSALPLVRSGKLRALGQTTLKRSVTMPDIPTIAESGVPGYVADNWYGMFVPAGTPAAIVARLNAEFAKALADPDVKAKLIAAGQDPAPSSPEEMGAALKTDIAQWQRVVDAAKIKLD